MANTKREALYIEGLDETIRRFRALPKDVKAGADELVREIPKFVASNAVAAASTAAERKAARSIKSQKNTVSLGGGGKKNREGRMALGTEFGGRARPRTQQFRAHRGKDGYFFWPSIRANSEQIKKMWDDLVEGLLEDIADGG